MIEGNEETGYTISKSGQKFAALGKEKWREQCRRDREVLQASYYADES